MPIQPDGEAPYNSAPATIAVIDRYRAGTLQTPVAIDVLRRAGIQESLVHRTLKALRLLELIDEEGHPTEQFQVLARTRPDEYKDAFTGYLRSVYKDVFTYTDPSDNDIGAIRNAFWGYKPAGQRETMVRLFLGLCEYTGLIPPQKRERPAPTPGKSKDTPTAPRTRKRKEQEERQSPPPSPPPPPPSPTPLDGIDPALVAWFQKVPPSGSPWPKADKDRWFAALRAMVDGVHPES